MVEEVIEHTTEKNSMNDFLKALRLSFRYKWTILASMINAIVIGFLWGASIATTYPFVDVVFEGKTLHTWVADGLARAEAETNRIDAEVVKLRGQLASTDAKQKVELGHQIKLLERRGEHQQKEIHWKRRLKPYIERWAPRTPFGTLTMVIGILILTTAVKGFCLVLSVTLVARIAGRTVADMRQIFYRELLKMDQRTIDKIGTTNLMTMLSHNVGLVQSGLQCLYGKNLIEPFKMIFCLLWAAWISWQLLVVSLLLAPLGFLLIFQMGRRMRKSAGREIDGYAAVFQTLLDSISGIKLVKIFTREAYERRRFKEDSMSLYHMSMRISFFDALLRPITELMAVATLSTAILCGAYLVLTQQTHLWGIRMSTNPLSAAEVLTFFAMLSGMADPGRKMTDIYNVMVRAMLASKSLYDVFETPSQIAAPTNPKPMPTHNESLRFENVTFSYDPGCPVLRNLNINIPFGQTVALVGINGSGKSTVANLIARFYDPDSGIVRLDGVDLRDIRPRQLRKQIGIVTQDPMLFRGSVISNIRYGNPHATKEEVIRAAELAHVSDFVHQLGRGYESEVGDRGSYLSGGQRQRVALARAILSNPRIMILDEATSQMDVEVETLVHEALVSFLRERTTILVTHRPSTLLLADRVVVMRDGCVIEDKPMSEVGRHLESFATLIAKAA